MYRSIPTCIGGCQHPTCRAKISPTPVDVAVTGRAGGPDVTAAAAGAGVVGMWVFSLS